MFPSIAAVITAAAGGGQLNATKLAPDFNRITTVATIGDSVQLPMGTSPIICVIINATNQAVQVFGNGSDTINGVASATGISQLGNSVDLYICGGSGLWFVEGGLGYNGQYPTVSSANAITAKPAGTQANSTLMSAAINRVTTVATAGDSALLPTAAAGMEITIINASANSMNVFPNTGDAINALAANASYAIAGGKTVSFFTANNGAWHSVLSA